MIYLNDVIIGINGVLQQRLSAYKAITFSGIADYKYDQSSSNTVISPVIVPFGGNKSFDINTSVDTISLYHRLGNIAVTGVPGQDYGDGRLKNYRYMVDMQVLMIGTVKHLNIDPYQLSALIADAIPSSMDIVDQPVPVRNITINITSIQNDKRAVFNQEFSGVRYFLGPEYFFFSIKYKIDSSYLNGCTTICEC